MLQKSKIEYDPNEPGHFVILDEMEDWPCEWCGAESVRNTCAGDGRLHHHGGVHTVDGGGPTALCRSCATIAAMGWARADPLDADTKALNKFAQGFMP